MTQQSQTSAPVSMSEEQLNALVDEFIPTFDELRKYLNEAVPALSEEGFQTHVTALLAIAQKMTEVAVNNICESTFKDGSADALDISLILQSRSGMYQVLKKMVEYGTQFPTRADQLIAAGDAMDAALDEQEAYADQAQQMIDAETRTPQQLHNQILDF